MNPEPKTTIYILYYICVFSVSDGYSTYTIQFMCVKVREQLLQLLVDERWKSGHQAQLEMPLTPDSIMLALIGSLTEKYVQSHMCTEIYAETRCFLQVTMKFLLVWNVFKYCNGIQKLRMNE